MLRHVDDAPRCLLMGQWECTQQTGHMLLDFRCQLAFMQTLLSARDNAQKDKGLDPEKLRINKAFVGKGQHSKRMNTHARGRSGVRLVYHAHLTIILAEGRSKRVTRFRPPNAQWNKNKRKHAASTA